MSLKLTRITRTAWGLALLALVIGFWFHTSRGDHLLFGKYTLRALIRLCAITGLGVLAFLYVGKLFSTTVLHLPSGRTLTIRPAHKLLAFTWLALAAAAVGEAILHVQLRREISRRRFTVRHFHPFLQFVHVPDDVEFHANRWGFRGEDIAKKKPANTCRIFFLGGSTVECDSIPFEQSFCRLIEKRLRRRFPRRRIEVQNAGVQWHTSLHSLIRFQTRIRDFSPDIVVAYHGVNDLVRSFQSDRFTRGPYRSDYGHFLGPDADMVADYISMDGRGCLLLNRLRREFAKQWFSDFRRGPARPVREVVAREFPSLRAFERNMTELARAARASGAAALICSQPNLFHPHMSDAEKARVVFPKLFCEHKGERPDLASFARGLRLFNLASRRAAKAAGAYFFDLEARVPKTLDHFADEVHYTARGNQAVADALTAELLRLRLVERAFSSASQSGKIRLPSCPRSEPR